MIVITLTNCPQALRGDLTKWLQEISTGVFVGQVSARVREGLWKRICSISKNGRATMVYSARNEQHLEFRVHNTEWKPIDFDGIKLMLRPNSSNSSMSGLKQEGFSEASKRKTISNVIKRQNCIEPHAYVVVDLETTGLDYEKDEIIEIAAIKIINGKESDVYNALIKSKKSVPSAVSKLTGLSDEILLEKGVELSGALEQFLIFVGELPVLSHNVAFDCSFIQEACDQCGEDSFENDTIDTRALAEKSLHGVPDYRLKTLAEYFGIDTEHAHRSIPDCRMTFELFKKLIEFAP